MYVKTMSNLTPVVICGVDGCAAFLGIMSSCAHPPKGGLNVNAFIYEQ